VPGAGDGARAAATPPPPLPPPATAAVVPAGKQGSAASMSGSSASLLAGKVLEASPPARGCLPRVVPGELASKKVHVKVNTENASPMINTHLALIRGSGSEIYHMQCAPIHCQASKQVDWPQCLSVSPPQSEPPPTRGKLVYATKAAKPWTATRALPNILSIQHCIPRRLAYTVAAVKLILSYGIDPNDRPLSRVASKWATHRQGDREGTSMATGMSE